MGKENELTPTQVANKALNTKTDGLVMEIVSQDDPTKLQDLTHLFNLAQTKKAVLRTQTYNELLDNVTEQMRERVTKRADQFSNKDLLDYVNVITTAAEKAAKQIGLVEDIPLIQINTQNNIEINDGSNLSKESRQKVMDAVGAALSSMGLTLDNLGILQKANENTAIKLVEEIEENKDENNIDSFVQINEDRITEPTSTSTEDIDIEELGEIQIQFETEEENF